MKKLMTVIAAVAMSFGLFAATPFSISFESAESAKGVDAANLKFTPGEDWNWTGTSETLDMVAYDGDEYTGYGAEGSATARRSSFFDDKVNNLNYLKLETGSAELERAMGTDNIFVDQLVKFTGFEEVQTNLVDGTKIAVWMSGIEGDNTVEPVVEGETNLYVTCAKVDVDGNVEQVALKIAGDFETEKWYRLTIKSIGNIFETVGSRAGFIVYIDGIQVGCADESATKLIVQNKDKMTTDAAGYMAKGQLFPAIDATDTIFTTVVYKGIGSIDDVILDDQGPDFCQFVNVTVKEIPGALIKVEQEGEEIKKGDDGKYAVAPGVNFIVTYTGDTENGYMPFEKAIEHTTESTEVDDTDAVKDLVKLVVVTVTYDGTNTVAYADADSALLAVALYTQTPGNTVAAEFMQGATNLVAGYAFDKGTYISIYDDSADVEPGDPLSSFWDINGGNVTFTNGLENNKKVSFSAWNPDEEIDTFTLTFGGVMKAGSQIITDDLAALPESITLDPADCFVEIKGDWTDPTLSYKVVFAPVEGYAIKEELITIGEDEDALTYTKYSLEVAAADVVEIVGTGAKYKSLDAAIDAADDNAELKLLDNITLTETTEIDKAITLDLAGKTLTYTECEGLHVTADGAVVSNGAITVTAADNKNWYTAIRYTDVGGLVKAMTISTSYAKYGVVTDSDGYEQVDKTLVCEDVDITGAGALFYCESMKMTLDADCSATQSGTNQWGEYYEDAIAAGYLGQLTVAGGTYAGVNAIGMMSSPATITINGGKFTGEIKLHEIDAKYAALGEHTLAITDGDFNASDLKVEYLANEVATGYKPVWVDSTISGYKTPGAEAIEYTITYNYTDDQGAVQEIKDLSPNKYNVKDAGTLALPTEMPAAFVGGTFEGWYANAELTGEPVTVIPAGSMGPLTFWAKIKKVIDPVQEEIDEKVDETGLDDTQKENVKKNMSALNDACGGNIETAKAWITSVYGTDAKIPGAKLAATDADLIAISVAYDLPIVTEEPTATVAAAESTSGAPAFQFTITADADVNIDLAKAKVQKIVKYSADLATGAFGDSTDKVSITTTSGSNVMKAEFVAGPAKGFMKADFTTAE